MLEQVVNNILFFEIEQVASEKVLVVGAYFYNYNILIIFIFMESKKFYPRKSESSIGT